jgi:hypothetical protein
VQTREKDHQTEVFSFRSPPSFGLFSLKALPIPEADPEGVQWGLLEPLFEQQYLIFMGILVGKLQIII